MFYMPYEFVILIVDSFCVAKLNCRQAFKCSVETATLG